MTTRDDINKAAQRKVTPTIDDIIADVRMTPVDRLDAVRAAARGYESALGGDLSLAGLSAQQDEDALAKAKSDAAAATSKVSGLEGELKAERAASAAATKDAADQRARADAYTLSFPTPALAQEAKDRNTKYTILGTPEQIEAEQKLLHKYKAFGSVDDVKKKSDEHAEYSKNGSPADVQKKSEEHAEYSKHGTPADVKKKADEHALYAKHGSPDDIDKKLAAKPAPGGPMPDPTPTPPSGTTPPAGSTPPAGTTPPAGSTPHGTGPDPASLSGALGSATGSTPPRWKQAGVSALVFTAAMGVLVGGYHFMTKKEDNEGKAPAAPAPVDPELLKQLTGRADATDRNVGALETRVRTVERNTEVLPSLTLHALRTDAAVYFAGVERTAEKRYQAREYQLLDTYRALTPEQRREKIGQLRTDLAALDTDYAKIAAQIRQAKFADAAVMQFNTSQYVTQHSSLTQYLDRAIRAFGADPTITQRPGFATELLNLLDASGQESARVGVLEERARIIEERLNKPSPSPTGPAGPSGVPPTAPTIPAGLSLEQQRIRGYITQQQYNEADRARRK